MLTGLGEVLLSLIQDGAVAAGAVGFTSASGALRRALPKVPLAPDSTGETLLWKPKCDENVLMDVPTPTCQHFKMDLNNTQQA